MTARVQLSAAPITVGVALLLGATLGCPRDEASPAAAFTRTDSAGFVIAANGARIDGLRNALTVAPQPRLRIGVEAGAEELHLTDVISATRLPDGRIAVANGRPTEIRVFDSLGRFLTKHGRAGPGPEDFQRLTRLHAVNSDTLIAVDAGRMALMRFTVGSGFAGATGVSRDWLRRIADSLRLDAGPSDYFRNGAVVVGARIRPEGGDSFDQYPTGELFRPSTALSWLAPDGIAALPFGEFGDIQQIFVHLGGGKRSSAVPPSARRKIETMGPGGDRFCVAANEEAEVWCLDQDGRRLIIRWSQDDVPTSEETIERWRQSRRDRAGTPGNEDRQVTERIIAGIIIPPMVPPIFSLIVDRDRRVFVAGPDLGAPTERGARYRVFSANGELLGVTDLPRVAVHDMGRDYLLGVARNADGVESVVVHDVSWTVKEK